jgi:hypothetical protein
MPCNCQSTHQVTQPKTQTTPVRNPNRPAFASMRYTGPTSATTTGPVSGREYKFTRFGATLQVDPRDMAALTKVPHLRQI